MNGLINSIFRVLPSTQNLFQNLRNVHGITATTNQIVSNNMWSFNPCRTNVIITFPRPRETKRIKVHGWNKRLSTRSGRKIIMARILKGRHVLSH